MQDLTLEEDNYAEGWALVPKRKKGKLDQDVVAFVEQKFWQGKDFGQVNFTSEKRFAESNHN